MVNVCYYISDYGYGHASRSIAIIRDILSIKKVKIYIKTGYPFDFVRQSLPQENIEVIKTKNDIGVTFKQNSFVVDKAKTRKMLDEWIISWNDYIKREREFCEKNDVDIILSDISPQPFIVAKELGITSIAISNFTWYYIFSELLGQTKSTEKLKCAYESADMVMVLPFNEEMECVKNKKEVDLVARNITETRESVRKKHSVMADDLLVFIGVGKSFDHSFLKEMMFLNSPNVKFLFSSHIELPFEKGIRIPIDETETQNYMAACDLIISKSGYGVVSEAVQAKIPLLLLKREGFKEDELMHEFIKINRIGKTISKESLLSGEWVNELENLDKYKTEFENLGLRFKKDGKKEILDTITGLMGF